VNLFNSAEVKLTPVMLWPLSASSENAGTGEAISTKNEVVQRRQLRRGERIKSQTTGETNIMEEK
jgi:hypothetical protein